MPRPLPKSRAKEPTIALINIVFLMLVFFLVAGTLARPLPQELTLVSTDSLEASPPPDALVLHADGSLTFRGGELADAAAFLKARDSGAEGGGAVRVVPDRDVLAETLVHIARALKAGGAEKVFIVTEQALK
jgi:biopolymer transport protein ExbD